ncbi:antichymotrypsin-2-like [Epargyreus clarus]|uniref:antichymotrypsin-2-like n=1 Tax=Epargyreus clarus TaxID=520877 RepID=UPI003C2E7FE2
MKSLYLFLFALTTIAVVESIIDPATTLQNGNDGFTAKMFSEVVKNNKEKSIVLSAFSALIPLAQIVLAAVGPSHNELLKSIGFHDDNTTKAVSILINDKVSSIKGIELKMVNRLYVCSNYQIREDFDEISRNIFHSEIVKTNFADEENAAKNINAWVKDQTNHCIENVVEPSYFNSDTRAVLVNALYFKGTWKYPFDKEDTLNKDFYVNKQKTIQVPMMNTESPFKYRQSRNLKSKLLSLPYDGEETSLLIILPNDIEGIGDLIKMLKNPYILDDEMYAMYKTDVDVSIPKFKIETTIDLKDVLKKMNVTKIFGENANLSRLLKSNETLYISNAIQKAFIEVNEYGVEAAATNGIVTLALRSNMEPLEPIRFIADHPFVFFLRADDLILFSGVFYGS